MAEPGRIKPVQEGEGICVYTAGNGNKTQANKNPFFHQNHQKKKKKMMMKTKTKTKKKTKMQMNSLVRPEVPLYIAGVLRVTNLDRPSPWSPSARPNLHRPTHPFFFFKPYVECMYVCI